MMYIKQNTTFDIPLRSRFYLSNRFKLEIFMKAKKSSGPTFIKMYFAEERSNLIDQWPTDKLTLAHKEAYSA